MPKDNEPPMTLEDGVQRVGMALAADMGMRWNVVGNGNVIRLIDKWADNEFVVTVTRKDTDYDNEVWAETTKGE